MDRGRVSPRDGCRHAPALNGLLGTLGLDVAYHRAAGDCVYYRGDGGEEIEVLDVVGGYGTLLLGHAHPLLVEEAMHWLGSGQPNHVQGSRRQCADDLAALLSARTGRDDCVVFANSGAEAVEAALKHAMLETGGRTFVALEGGFHGKTLGALQLTASPLVREPFRLTGIDVVRVSPNDVTGLHCAFQQVDDLAGFIFEPILGEGGVHPLERDFVQRAAAICAEHRIPLIADECQTGLGRTGSFLASSYLGVVPDYVLLSKALGGGLAKISALLIDRTRYRREFDRLHTSTFASDGFSCAVALKTLELLDDELIDTCREKGARLRERLDVLRTRYPEVVADVRGRGLMLGLEFHPQPDSFSLLLRALTARHLLGPMLAGHLLKQGRVRIMPTLSSPLTLRIQPSALISDRQVDWLMEALEQACACLARDDACELTAHLKSGSEKCRSIVADAMPRSEPYVTFDSQQPLAFEKGRLRSVAWLFHLIDADDLPNFEPAFAGTGIRERAEYLERVAALAEPVVMRPVVIHSVRGVAARVYPLLLPVTSEWMKRMLAARRHASVRDLVQQGIRAAQALGCDVVSLGQFTSIVSANGRTLDSGGLGLTTGNTYTAALIIDAIRAAQAARGINPAESTLAVVGAGGNIGRICAEILGPDYERVILIGRDAGVSRQQLRDAARRIPRAEISCDLQSVRWADVVVCVTNGTTPLLMPANFRHSALVCDAAIPRAVHPDTGPTRPDVHLLHGGIVRLPYGEDLGVPGFPLPPGQAFGCMAEGVLLALEGIRDTSFTGRLSHERLRWIAETARRHGFALGGSPSDSAADIPRMPARNELVDACNR